MAVSEHSVFGPQTVPLGDSPIPSSGLTQVIMPISSESDSSSGLYAAFRLARLVNSFRKRIKTRVLSHGVGKKETSEADQDSICSAFEKAASKEIDNYLGRKLRHNGKKVAKTKSEADLCTSGLLCHDAVASPTHFERESIESLLKDLDGRLPFRGHSLSELAANDDLLLEEGTEYDLKKISKADILDSLSLTGRLLALVQHAYYEADAALCQDAHIGQEESSGRLLFLANLVHLLLSLQSQILYQLFVVRGGKVVEDDIFESQKEQKRRCKEWFSIFPDGRRPLGTTWPWNIRPSLIVLWGVCWMFFDKNIVQWEDIMIDAQGNWIDSQTGTIMLDEEFWRWLESQPVAVDPTLTMQGLNQPHEATRASPEVRSATRPTQAPRPSSSSSGSNLGRVTAAQAFPATNISTRRPFAQPVHYDDAYANALQGQAHIHFVEPAVPNESARPTYCSRSPAASIGQQGQNFISLDRGTLPPHRRHVEPLPDETRVTEATGTAYQDPAGQVADFPPYKQPFPHNPVHSRASLIASGMDPDSSRGRQTSADSEQHELQRARSLSSNTQELLDSAPGRSPAHSPVRSPPRSAGGSVNAGDDTVNPLPQREKPRIEPTIDQEGKYVCTQCGIKPFDRRCEWNKHMDKHDRPYVCKNPDCSSLQGFTYSGGLLRHQREVHNLHGGAKLKLYCQFEGCKRRTQNPFTRRENLAEHLRRVHKTSPEPSSPPPNTVSQADGGEDSRLHVKNLKHEQKGEETHGHNKDAVKKEDIELPRVATYTAINAQPANHISTPNNSSPSTQAKSHVNKSLKDHSQTSSRSDSHNTVESPKVKKLLALTPRPVTVTKAPIEIKPAIGNKRKRDYVDAPTEAMAMEMRDKDSDEVSLLDQFKRLKVENEQLKRSQEALQQALQQTQQETTREHMKHMSEIEGLRREVEKLRKVLANDTMSRLVSD